MSRPSGERSDAAAGRFEMLNTLMTRLLETWAFRIIALVILTSPWWMSGFSKLLDLPAAFAEAEHFGLKPAAIVVAATIAVQIFSSLLIIVERLAWLGAGALGVFTTLATLIAHPFWTVSDPVLRFHERNTFIEHIGLIGGLMLAAIISTRRAPI